MKSFLYPKVRVSMCFVRCPAPNRSVREFPDLGTWISGTIQLDLLSPLRTTPLLQRSMLSSSEASIQISQCGYRSEPPVPSRPSSRPGRQQRCCPRRLRPSQHVSGRLGLPHQISRCTFQRDKVEFAKLTHSLGLMFRCFSKIQYCWAKYESLVQADLFLVASSLCRSGLRLPSNTSLSCSFSRGVLSTSVFVLHPDSLMMSGECLKSGSMSKYCAV